MDTSLWLAEQEHPVLQLQARSSVCPHLLPPTLAYLMYQFHPAGSGSLQTAEVYFWLMSCVYCYWARCLVLFYYPSRARGAEMALPEIVLVSVSGGKRDLWRVLLNWSSALAPCGHVTPLLTSHWLEVATWFMIWVLQSPKGPRGEPRCLEDRGLKTLGFHWAAHPQDCYMSDKTTVP